jgi:epoxyqueuosine reductase
MSAPPGERLRELARRHGLELLGVAPAEEMPEVRSRMREAVDAGRMGRMGWMGGDRPELASDPRRHAAQARSVLVVAAPYAGRDRAEWDERPDRLHEALAPVLAAEPSEPSGLVARYALGSDYHVALRERLEALADELSADGMPTGAVAYVDDRPLAERALAARAGLGWIGKNSNLLTHHRAGSWVFIGAILSEAELEPDAPVRTSCGGCTRCLSGCPTGAIVAPRVVDARRCISYLTIEHPGPFVAWEAEAIDRWIFGCDVCQEVCPVNDEADDPGALAVPLVPLAGWLLNQGTRATARALAGTALTRAGRHRLLRNALAALGNALRSDPHPDWADAARHIARRAGDDRREEVRMAARRLAGLLDGGRAA